MLKIRTYPLQSKIACKKEPSTLHAQHASISKLLHYLNSHFNQEGIQTIGKNILPARLCAPMNYLTTSLRDEAVEAWPQQDQWNKEASIDDLYE